MKFTVSMKHPDALSDAIKDAVDEDTRKLGLSEDEREAVEEHRRETISKICGKWFAYGEYLKVEIDTEAKTCVVVPAK